VEKPENRAAVKEMIRAINESSRTAGQLLDHAMVTFRTDQLELETVDLVDHLGPVADLRDIALTLTSEASRSVKGDPILIENALRNVLDNAIKYSPREVLVRVTITEADSAAVISVRDQAGGFPNATLDQMTERFARGENAEGTVGSGLGLTIAREVMEAHGG